MARIKTLWGEVKLISSNLEGLYINGFCIPLDQTAEYVDDISVPSKDFVRKMIEKRLEKEVLFSGEEEEITINCEEESCGEEIVASWKICFEIMKDYQLQQKKKKKRLVELYFLNTKRNIPFEIKDNGIWIKIGKKEVRVPTYIYRDIRSIEFNLYGCTLKGIYR